MENTEDQCLINVSNGCSGLNQCTGIQWNCLYKKTTLFGWFLTAFWKLRICIRCCLYVFSVIAGIGDGRFDIFKIGSVGQIGYSGFLLLVVHNNLGDAFLVHQVFFNFLFTHVALDCRCVYLYRHRLFLLCHSSKTKADGENKDNCFFHCMEFDSKLSFCTPF